jgi:hypothetical protein
VGKLKYVLIYEGVPDQRFIYLDGLKEAVQPPRRPDAVLAVDAGVPAQQVICSEGVREEVHPAHQTDAVLAVDKVTTIEAHQIVEPMLIPPEFAAMLKSAVKSAVKAELKPAVKVIEQTQADVAELREKKKRQKRGWYQERGKATAKWRQHPKDVIAMCKHANKFTKRDKKGNILRGCLQTAVKEARGYWMRNHVDPEIKRWIDEQNVSTSTLERWILKDWRKER